MFPRLTRAALLTVCCTLMLACTPLTRGFVQNQLASNGYPPFTIGSTLPLLLEARGSAFVSTGITFQTPDIWLGVYGEKRADAPLAVVAFGTAPEGYEWAPTSSSDIDTPVSSQADFGGQLFNGTLRLIAADRDPFAPLLLSPEQIKAAGSAPYWLAQRYSDMSSNFWKSKIILEYREPVPAWLIPGMNPNEMIGSAELQAFSARAAKAFTASFTRPLEPISQAPYLTRAINQRYLGRFFGLLQYVEPLNMYPNGRD